jgi:hypothetical protein
MDAPCTLNLEVTDIMSSYGKRNCIKGTNRMVSISENYWMLSNGTVTLTMFRRSGHYD